ncbi:GlcNAc-transferase family protein [Paraburkholderia aspalathi]|uniref:GlcNAc-transferase family protein n=1 Tax=Paraburkholderia aspalathi TaxID=1324617 RepID=UPI0038BAF009
MENTIFVQIASYRDPELVPTLVDLIRRAKNPEVLRIVVCWQHSLEETLGEFWKCGCHKWRVDTSDGWTVHHMEYYGGARIELIDVPHFKTQGACWARNLVQQFYRGERYTLQLDSHHRFVESWDQILIDMLESLRDESPKPILTTYLPMYDAENQQTPNTSELYLTAFRCFSSEGVLQSTAKLTRSEDIPERPVRSRFYSAHFGFSDGHFCEAVQYDPELFFGGDEMSIAVRAFTHGYDLYNPNRFVAWHHNIRGTRPRMWDDHSDKAKENGVIAKTWWERNAHSLNRCHELFGVDGKGPASDAFGKYGVGVARTLTQYEAYAGVSFRYRGVQRATLDDLPPVPNTPFPDTEAKWKASLLRSNDIPLSLHQDGFDQDTPALGMENLLASSFRARAMVYDTAETMMHCQMLDGQELSHVRSSGWLSFHATFVSDLDRIPAYCIVELLNSAGDVQARIKQMIKA